ncbi:MAG: HAD family phosphatase [Lentimicrobium sp.]|jgi:beta-phosphoglucomutase family hydrolase|nr:HAD family phosphatase [Lentimicrobium sp.]
MSQDFAVIFDMDGVLVDNFRYHLMAWEKFCNRHKKKLSADDFRENVFGGSNADHLAFIFKKELSQETVATYSAEKELIYRFLYHDNVQLLAGLRPLLDELKSKGLPMAIATSAERENVDFILAETGLNGYFTAVADATMVTKGKPDPQVFCKAAELIHMPADRCLVFEDTLKGIDAALRANMKVVGVSTTHHRAELTEAHKVINDFTEIDVTEIMQLINLK